MNFENLTFNIVEKSKNANEINDENFSKNKIYKLNFEQNLSNQNKYVFKNHNVRKEILSDLYIGIGIALAMGLLFTFWQPSSKLGIMIATPIILGGIFTILGMIIGIFSSLKTIEIICNNNNATTIVGESILNRKSTIFNLNKIDFIECIKIEDYIYFNLVSGTNENLEHIILSYKKDECDNIIDKISTLLSKKINLTEKL
ncbi:hypothetical protein OBK15_11135 [Empedobacter falsenii]